MERAAVPSPEFQWAPGFALPSPHTDSPLHSQSIVWVRESVPRPKPSLSIGPHKQLRSLTPAPFSPHPVASAPPPTVTNFFSTPVCPHLRSLLAEFFLDHSEQFPSLIFNQTAKGLNSRMYIVVNICPGSEMLNLMESLAARALTFSVTDDLSKLCAKCSNGSSNPLPVPHQLPEALPTPTTSETNALQIEQKQSPQSQERRLPAPRARKTAAKRSREHMEEPSEPDAAVDQEMSVNSALHQLNHLASLAVAQSSSSIDQNSADIFRMPKVEMDTLMDTPNTSMADQQTANAMAMDLFKNFEAKCEPGINGQDEALATRTSTKDMFRGECRICQMPISIRSHHMRRHAMKHLGFKTFICKLCQKDFNRSDLCKTHFERYHPGITLIPFEDIITRDQQDRLDQMIAHCFPEEYRQRQQVQQLSTDEMRIL